MDNADEIKTGYHDSADVAEKARKYDILDYIRQHPADNSDLFTLWHAIGDEEFFKAVQDADGRRITIYTLPEDEGKDDPPIQWKYTRK